MTEAITRGQNDTESDDEFSCFNAFSVPEQRNDESHDHDRDPVPRGKWHKLTISSCALLLSVPRHYWVRVVDLYGIRYINHVYKGNVPLKAPNA